MTTTEELLSVARSQLGTVETGGTTGHNGNIVKYWQDIDPADQGSSWCAAFVSWCWMKAGHNFPAIDIKLGYVNCQDAVNYAKRNGLWKDSGKYSPGDTIIFDFEQSGVGSHTGIVISDDGHTVTTIEGNTSPGTAGSQANGGGVYQRFRPHGSTILGVLASSQWLNESSTPAPTTTTPVPPKPVVLLEEDMGRLCQVPGKKKVYHVYGGHYNYVSISDAVKDLLRLGATVGPDGRFWPIGQDTLLTLVYDGPEGHSATENI